MDAPQTQPPVFHSIVFPSLAHESAAQPRADLRDVLHDLLLDQIFDAAYGGFAPKEQTTLYTVRPDDEAPYRAAVHATLQALFASPLTELDVVRYRQDTMRDLQQDAVWRAMQVFQAGARTMRENLRRAERAFSVIEGQRWFLDAVLAYGDAVAALHGAMDATQQQSQALRALRLHLTALRASIGHGGLVAQAKALAEDLAKVRYAVRVEGGTVAVLQDPAEPDYSAAIARTFARFRQGEVRDYRARFTPASGLNHVEGMILDRVAMLHPEVFDRLARFRAEHDDFADARLLRLDRELAWYLSWHDFTRRFTRAGLGVCFPELTTQRGQIEANDAFDVALARNLLEAGQAVVSNGFALRGEERMIVVTGPNHGGKTTLARTFGQLHHIASLGLPVAASSATLLLFDRMFTHFEREEDIGNQRGKLQDDLVRMHRILAAAGPRSIVLMNELFSSTTLDDALELARRMMTRLRAIGAVCVFVTFLDELAAFDAQTVSMVATVDAADPTVRTFKVVRKPADGKSYALALAEKYGVTRERLLARIAP